MTTLQEYLNSEYPNKEIEYIKTDSIPNSKELEGGELKIENYPQLKEIEVNGYYLKSKLIKLEISNCPNLTKLRCFENQLTNLSINNCLKFQYLDCSRSELTELKINNCPKISSLKCPSNQLKNLDFLFNLNAEEINYLDVDGSFDSCCPKQDLSVFENFTNLEELCINANYYSNDDCFYFFGSLKPLRNLNKLKTLKVGSNRIDCDLENLPNELICIYCEKCYEWEKKLKGCYDSRCCLYDYQKWRKKNFWGKMPKEADGGLEEEVKLYNEFKKDKEVQEKLEINIQVPPK